MNLHRLIQSAAIGLFVIWAAATSAETYYAHVPLEDLTILEGELVQTNQGITDLGSWAWYSSVGPMMQPYIRMETEGSDGWFDYFNNQMWFPRRPISPGGAFMAISSSTPPPFRGTLYMPNEDWSGMNPVRFEVEEGAEDQEAARKAVLSARRQRYDDMARWNVAGSGWFRYLARETRLELGQEIAPFAGDNREQWRRQSELQRTYAIYSGGRAVAENLQLDRNLNVDASTTNTVKLESIEGITTQAYDWTELLEGKSPDLDYLSAYMPKDDLAVFLPSFNALTTLIDESMEEGPFAVAIAQPNSEDYHTFDLYQKRLCLPLDELTRKLGPTLVKTVAIAATDPYLRSGTDIAVLMESGKPATLLMAVGAQQTVSGGSPVVAEIDGQTVLAVRGKGVSSYALQVENAVIVATSLQQLTRIYKAYSDQEESIRSLEEYQFFRDRYPLGAEEETALFLLTDAAIRKWCGPKWRIASSRRLRAAAVMTHLQAKHLRELSGELDENRDLSADEYPEFLGTVTLGPDGVSSSVYGSLDYMTPIARLEIETVTMGERDAYDWFRRGYQRNWSRFFDPIALRLYVTQETVEADLTVMPLIAGSDYRNYMEITGDAKIEPGDGDPHEEALLHLVYAIDSDSRTVRQFTGFVSQSAPGISGDPLNWFGEWLALYTDPDPFWDELDAAMKENGKNAANDYLEDNWPHLPLVLEIDVANPIKLTVFLTGLRSFIEQTVPGMTVWETKEHAGRSYVAISPSADALSNIDEEAFREMSLYYAALPTRFALTLSESQIQKVIERVSAPTGDDTAEESTATPDEAELPDWIGESMAAYADAGALSVIMSLWREPLTARLVEQSWSNIFILNEWRLKFGAKDAVAFHKKWWGTELVCPGGGEYVWNPEFQTYESTVFGSPARQITTSIPEAANPLNEIDFINTGITFEHDGLRARGSLRRRAQ